jgi:hypothetical protein
MTISPNITSFKKAEICAASQIKLQTTTNDIFFHPLKRCLRNRLHNKYYPNISGRYHG